MKIKMEDIVSAERVIGFREEDKVKYFQFKLSWKMTNWCNYRCSYCYMSKTISNTHNQTPFKDILTIAKNINYIIPKGRFTELHLIGGEVGWYNLVEVLDQITSPDLKRVIVATNFSSPIEFWKVLKEYCKSRGIQLLIIASFHLEMCDKDEFVSKAIEVNAKVKCVVNSKNIKEYMPYFEKLKKHNIRIQPTVERDSFNLAEKFDKENLKYLDELNNALKTTIPYYKVTMKDGTVHWFYSNIEFINSIDIGGFDGEDFYCSAGIDGLRIDVNGRVIRAGCQMCSTDSMILGNLLNGDIPKPVTEGVICKSLQRRKRNTDGSYIVFKKYCTAFNNTSMYRNVSDELYKKASNYSEEFKLKRLPTDEEKDKYYKENSK